MLSMIEAGVQLNPHTSRPGAGEPFVGLPKVFASALFALIAAHFAVLNAHNPLIFAGGVGIAALAFAIPLLVKRDVFAFVLVLLICSHFAYIELIGGLWNVIALAALCCSVAREIRLPGDAPLPRAIRWLVGFVLIAAFAGWIIRDVPVSDVERWSGRAAFLAMVACGVVVGRLRMTVSRIRAVLITVGAMSIYMSCVGTIQRLDVTPPGPLFGEMSVVRGLTSAAMGTLQDSELYGEIAMLTLIVFIGVGLNGLLNPRLRIVNAGVVALVCTTSTVSIIYSASRSAALLAAAGACAVTLHAFHRHARRAGRVTVIAIGIVVVLYVAGGLVGVVPSVEVLSDEITDTDWANMSLGSVITGASINRGVLFDAGLDRLRSDSWFVGYGPGAPRANRFAVTGNVDGIMPGVPWPAVDLHSLYLALPMVFGWAGAFAMVALLTTAFVRAARSAYGHNAVVSGVAAALAVVWLALLINEYKISMLRSMAYQSLVWWWWGFTNAVVTTARASK